MKCKYREHCELYSPKDKLCNELTNAGRYRKCYIFRIYYELEKLEKNIYELKEYLEKKYSELLSRE